jgi:hypothetical protein
MGITSRGAAGDLGTLRAQDRTPQNLSVPVKQTSSQRPTVTDESENDIEMKTNSNMQHERNGNSADNKTPKRKLGALKRSGPLLEEEQSSEQETAGPSSQTNPTLAQHERIQQVEALDISYRCTPASLKLKGVLVSRLSEAAPSGRIQVVSQWLGC